MTMTFTWDVGRPAEALLVVVVPRRRLDEAAQERVVAGARDADALADGCLLGTATGPPAAFEVENRAIPCREAHRAAIVVGATLRVKHFGWRRRNRRADAP